MEIIHSGELSNFNFKVSINYNYPYLFIAKPNML